jgi:hypothetical protein
MTPESEQTVTKEPVLVLGMGATGASCARYLARRGVSAMFADTRRAPTGIIDIRRAMPEADVRTGSMPADIPKAVSRLVVSPGLPMETPLIQLALQQGVEVLSDIDLFIAECTQPLLAVTGSNGKSTVASMVAAILDAAGWKVGVGGNLGPPALDLLELKADVYVLELSSFQLERSHELPAAAAVILNIATSILPGKAIPRPRRASTVPAKLRCLIATRPPLWRWRHPRQPESASAWTRRKPVSGVFARSTHRNSSPAVPIRSWRSINCR